MIIVTLFNDDVIKIDGQWFVYYIIIRILLEKISIFELVLVVVVESYMFLFCFKKDSLEHPFNVVKRLSLKSCQIFLKVQKLVLLRLLTFLSKKSTKFILVKKH